MQLTKQHKILGAVLGLGALAIVVDRLVFLKKDPVAGQPAAEYAVVTTPTAHQHQSPATTKPAENSVSLAQRLRDAAKHGDQSRDAFAFVVPVGTTARPVAGELPDPEQFRKSHRLTGVLSSAAGARAVVDGKIVTIGQLLDGFKLVSIDHRTATFEAGEARVVLNMADGSASAAMAETSP